MVEDLSSKATEMMKKVLTAGIGAFFLTEESFRKFVSDFKLPKELLSAVVDAANKNKEDFLRTLSREIMGQIMSRVNVPDLVNEILNKHEIDVHLNINFQSKSKKSGMNKKSK